MTVTGWSSIPKKNGKDKFSWSGGLYKAKHSLNFFVFYFVLFSRGFLGFLTTSNKNLAKTRKNKKKKKKKRLGDYIRPNISLKSLFFLFFSVFSRFSGFLIKSSKNLEKTKKRLGDFVRPDISLKSFFVFFCFLGLSGVRKGSRNKRIKNFRCFFFAEASEELKLLVRNYQLLLPWKHMKRRVRIEHSEKKNKM